MLAASAFPANAAEPAYGEAFDTLYRIDLDARQASAIGVAGSYAGQRIGNISGLSQTGDGSLYAVSGAAKLLLSLDPVSGAATVVGKLSVAGQGTGPFDALDLNMVAGCDGELLLTSAVARQLWSVDPATAVATPIGPTGAAITGLVMHNRTLYGAGGKGDNTFYRIDAQTGAATPIGSFGPGVTRWVNSVSMSFDADGVLWAVLNYVPPQHDSDPPADWSDLARIDPRTGTVTVLGPITGPESLRQVGMKGFSAGPTQCRREPGGSAPVTAPVDAPWALALLGLVLAAGGAAGLRARRRA
jgi:hypothetical protein